MGGGAPLAFLNKKTWHPGRMQNLEEVWKREQQAAAEQRKLEELRKQYEDERKNAEFTQMAEAAGYKKDTRLDWMYAGSLAAKHSADAAAAAAAAGSSAPAAPAGAQQEQPLMGKAPAPDEHLPRAERAAKLPSFLAADTPASQNEAWARLNNDPLLAIKKQEQDALKRVRENPIKMQQILKEVEKVRSHKHKKKEKKEKKEKKDRKRSRSRSVSRSRSPPPMARTAPMQRGRDGRGTRSPIRPVPAAAAAAAQRDGYDYDKQQLYVPGRHDAGGGSSSSSRRQQDHVSDRRGRDRSRSRSRDRVHRTSHQQQPEDPHRHEHHHSSRVEAREQHGSHHGSHHHHLSSVGAGGGGKYGLEVTAGRSRHAPDVQQLAAEAEARAAATRQRLAEAAATKAEEARVAAAAAAQRRQQQQYRTGQLSAEEKAARLAAMMGNAQEHDQQRLDRLHQARAAEEADRAGVAGLLAKAAASKAEDAFKAAAAAEVFGSLAGSGGMSVDARIASRRHYHER